MDSETPTPLEAACKAVGGTSKLADLLSERMAPRKVSKASVSRWKREDIPAEVCPDIEALTGVRCERLRPDVNWAVLRHQGPHDDDGFDPSSSFEPSGK